MQTLPMVPSNGKDYMSICEIENVNGVTHGVGSLIGIGKGTEDVCRVTGDDRGMDTVLEKHHRTRSRASYGRFELHLESQENV